MGDIINILRHSKTVADQSVREKLMAEADTKKVVARIKPEVSEERPRIITSKGELTGFTRLKLVPIPIYFF